MKKNLLAYVLIGGILLVIALFAFARIQPGKLDEFASCLGEKGATFYGAFWCPHCQEQKRLFANSEKKLPYKECSTADGQGQTQVCKDANIQSYPTWEFQDGERLTGVISLSQLAQKTGCELPEGFVDESASNDDGVTFTEDEPVATGDEENDLESGTGSTSEEISEEITAELDTPGLEVGADADSEGTGTTQTN